ncbi:Na(+)/H(+) antiporter subunit C [Domibacillus epiphyticus]|uniref:Na(+)/H(+) antiporter subunit C n=1 Tax=Domibacillus epiphyticus TaxID=1714355 RepID=A0A1V2ABQ5_9BACI|nr:Na(+)/H(+) antiporter subunit C [Domibacillus epiphyticus]OMP68234.1 Na(+)/H(+) antiporter subunit C [Domibacillus epiphyticus]
METMIILLAGVLVSVATYLLLSKNMIRVVLGTAILSHAVHLLLMTMGGLKIGSVPILGDTVETYTDALPQALILTAIVISFAVTAFFLVLVYRTYQTTGTDNLLEMKGTEEDE